MSNSIDTRTVKIKMDAALRWHPVLSTTKIGRVKMVHAITNVPPHVTDLMVAETRRGLVCISGVAMMPPASMTDEQSWTIDWVDLLAAKNGSGVINRYRG